MKIPDVTKPVMQKIINYENKRTSWWLRRFAGAVLALSLLVVVSVLITINQLRQFQTFDLLTLFQEDWEIVAEFWQDTLLTIWEELPFDALLLALGAVILIAGAIYFTRTKRQLIQQKIRAIEKYKKIHNN